MIKGARAGEDERSGGQPREGGNFRRTRVSHPSFVIAICLVAKRSSLRSFPLFFSFVHPEFHVGNVATDGNVNDRSIESLCNYTYE